MDVRKYGDRNGKISQEELDEIIKKHQIWLIGDIDGTRMHLEDYDLSGLDFAGMMLDDAILKGCNLREADFGGACLVGVLFNKSDVTDAHFSSADVHNANFQEAIGTETTELMNIPMACPDTGSFIGWKKVEIYGENGWVDDYGFCKYAIAKLLIPEDALRSSGTGRKCRCNKAQVLAIEDYDGNPIECHVDARSSFDSTFKYPIGETVEEPNFDPNRFNVCSKGIHFFIDRQEAVRY